MKRLRLSGSERLETCSAETVVPRITNRSTPASTTVWENCWVRCGDSAPATVTPAARISCRRCVMSAAWIGAAYSSCMRAIERWASSWAISASNGSGSS